MSKCEPSYYDYSLFYFPSFGWNASSKLFWHTFCFSGTYFSYGTHCSFANFYNFKDTFLHRLKFKYRIFINVMKLCYLGWNDYVEGIADFTDFSLQCHYYLK